MWKMNENILSLSLSAVLYDKYMEKDLCVIRCTIHIECVCRERERLLRSEHSGSFIAESEQFTEKSSMSRHEAIKNGDS